MSGFVSRAFGGRRRVPQELAGRIPPGQYNEIRRNGHAGWSPRGGVKVSAPGGIAIAPKEAYVGAFEAVLREAGVDAFAESRED